MVSHGFVSYITKTDVENEERLHALSDVTEGPVERLVTLFEREVLSLETGAGGDEGGEDGEGSDGDQGL